MVQQAYTVIEPKVCIQAKWVIRPELIPVSVAWSDWEYFYCPLDGMLVHHRVIPRYSFIHLGGERHWESKVSWPTTQHNVAGQDSNPDRSLELESSTLTTSPPAPHLHLASRLSRGTKHHLAAISIPSVTKLFQMANCVRFQNLLISSTQSPDQMSGY